MENENMIKLYKVYGDYETVVANGYRHGYSVGRYIFYTEHRYFLYPFNVIIKYLRLYVLRSILNIYKLCVITGICRYPKEGIFDANTNILTRAYDYLVNI